MLASSVDDQKHILHEVIDRLSTLTSQKAIVADQRDAPSASFDGSSSLGHHKPTPVQLVQFAGTNPERWVSQAKRYIAFYNIKDEDRMLIFLSILMMQH